jgi:6-pyruvoyltetrahydropterin/6-carboxytetrahydropterin synthase
MIQQIYPSIPHDYRYELNKDMQFASAHFVPGNGAGHCNFMHGHTYFLNLTVVGDELDENGFLVDFSLLKKLIHGRLDHSVLNEHPALFGDDHPSRYPTTENVARIMCELVQEQLDLKPNKPKCLQVFLRETPTSYVVYRPGRG